MQQFAPFEERPRLAVAVSGGADSMALALLAQEWVAKQSGTMVALHVDHRVRADSALEAQIVQRWLKQRNIGCEVLVWLDNKPSTGLQHAARLARYQLLGQFCRDHSILHLLTAHHAGDQRETVLMRQSRQESINNAAGMSARVIGQPEFLPGLRLLRPCLAFEPEQLRQVCRDQNQQWLEDPSNQNQKFERVRVRRSLTKNLKVKLNPEPRQELEQAVNQLSVQSLSPHPFGFVWFDHQKWLEAPDDVAKAAMARWLTAISGQIYPPAAKKLTRLRQIWQELGPKTQSLHGCRIIAHKGQWLIVRELRGVKPLRLLAGEQTRFDGRYDVTALRLQTPVEISPLGQSGYNTIKADLKHSDFKKLPKQCLYVLPAIYRLGQLKSVPDLAWGEANLVRISLNPSTKLSISIFTVVESENSPR